MDIKGIKVAVIGLGASGYAAARLAAEQGGDVHVSESRTDDATAARGADLGDAGIDVELGRHDIGRLAEAGLVVASPGIPPDAPVLRALAERGVRWISEPEFAARFLPGSLIAVTGTNGKTTTTLLVDHLLRASGFRSAAGGNVGGALAPAASDLARSGVPYDWVVLEMSSFQLAGVEAFRPDIGVVTNLSPDHLDRYRSVEAYYADKARLFVNADERSTWVLPCGDEAVARTLALLEKTTSEKLAELGDAIHARNIERCVALSHFIKGGVSMLGMRQFADLVLEMERDARAGRLNECATLLPRLRESFRRDMLALHASFSRLLQ